MEQQTVSTASLLIMGLLIWTSHQEPSMAGHRRVVHHHFTVLLPPFPDSATYQTIQQMDKLLGDVTKMFTPFVLGRIRSNVAIVVHNKADLELDNGNTAVASFHARRRVNDFARINLLEHGFTYQQKLTHLVHEIAHFVDFLFWEQRWGKEFVTTPGFLKSRASGFFASDYYGMTSPTEWYACSAEIYLMGKFSSGSKDDKKNYTLADWKKRDPVGYATFANIFRPYVVQPEEPDEPQPSNLTKEEAKEWERKQKERRAIANANRIWGKPEPIFPASNEEKPSNMTPEESKEWDRKQRENRAITNALRTRGTPSWNFRGP